MSLLTSFLPCQQKDLSEHLFQIKSNDHQQLTPDPFKFGINYIQQFGCRAHFKASSFSIHLDLINTKIDYVALLSIGGAEVKGQ